MTALDIAVSNVGGIDYLEATFESGTSLVAAPNASNKTSLLKAIAFGLGMDDISIRSGASSAEVTLTIGEKTVTRAAHRRGPGMEFTGTPWLSDEEIRAQFAAVASLLEFNDLRTAVRQGSDVEAALKAPIDFDALERKRSELLEEKASVRRKRDALADVEDQLNKALADRKEINKRQAELTEKLNALEDGQEPAPVNEDNEELRERRAELLDEQKQRQERIEATEDAIERDEDERSSLEDRIGELEGQYDDTDLQELRTEHSRLQSELDALRDRVGVFQSVLTANREMRLSEYTGVLGSRHRLAGDEVTCWTCGQSTTVRDIDGTLSELQSLIADAKKRVKSQEPDIDTIEETVAEVRSTESELDRLRADRREIAERIADREASLGTLSTNLSGIQSELDTVTEELEAARHKRAADNAETAEAIEATRVELRTLEYEERRLNATAEDLRADIEQREQLDGRLTGLSGDIQKVTERLERMEGHLRMQFNDAMDDLLTTLDFDRVKRVWLDGEFEIVVAREFEGTIQQDSVGNLAESERELVGLVLGLAGYLAYDLSGTVPVLVLDSLGALDNERVLRLVEYFRDIPTYLIAAVHPSTVETLDEERVALFQSHLLHR